MKPIVTTTTTTVDDADDDAADFECDEKQNDENECNSRRYSHENEAYLNVKWVNVSDDAGDDDDDLSVIVEMRPVTLMLFCPPPLLHLTHK